MSARLAPIDSDAFGTTRAALHAVAEHVLAAVRYATEGRIGLVSTAGGFGTPTLPDGRAARVAGDRLIVANGDQDETFTLTTLRAAADACGVEPGAPPVYEATTPLELDAPLRIDPTSADALAAWFAFGWDCLLELARDDDATITLWPEHFDAAVELGDEDRGTRGTYGVSPGDGPHPAPYLYVMQWVPKAPDPYWNDTAFDGASLGYGVLEAADDPEGLAREFFTRGRILLARP